MTDSPASTLENLSAVVRRSAVYATGALAGRLAGFVLIPLYTRVLSTDELGSIFALQALAGLLTTIGGLGFNSAFVRTYNRVAPERRNAVIGSSFAVLSISATAFFAIGYLCRRPLAGILVGDPSLAPLISLVLASMWFEIGMLTVLSWARTESKAGLFVGISLTRFVLVLSLAIYFVAGLGRGVEGVLAAQALANGLVYAVAVWFLVSRVRHVSNRVIRDLVTFGTPIAFSAVAGFLIEWSDIWLLRHFRGLDEVGVYGAGYRISRLLNVFITQPFLLAWPTVMWPLSQRVGADRVIARVLVAAVATGAFVGCGIALFRRELLGVLATDSYAAAETIMPWVALAGVIQLSTYVLNSGVSLAGRTSRITVAALAGLAVNLTLNVLFIPTHGMQAAALSTVAAHLVLAGLVAAFGHRLHPIPYEWRRVGLILVVSGLVVLAGDWLSLHLPAAVHLPGRVVLLVGAAALALSPAFLRPEERRGLDSIRDRWRG